MQYNARNPFVVNTDRFQIATEDRVAPAFIGIASSDSVTAVYCTVTLKYLFTYVTLMNTGAITRLLYYYFIERRLQYSWPVTTLSSSVSQHFNPDTFPKSRCVGTKYLSI